MLKMPYQIVKNKHGRVNRQNVERLTYNRCRINIEEAKCNNAIGKNSRINKLIGEREKREMNKANRARILTVIMAISFIIVLAGIADAATITGSKHDLSSTSGGKYKASGTGADQLCSFCHTPHFGSSATANLPLWNRTTTASGYTMYTSATIDMTTAAQPQGVSAACLSCHDGVVALDALMNKPGSGLTGGALTFTPAITGNKMNATDNPASFISQNLSNDHPISITYDTTKDTKFIAAVAGKVGVLPLYGASKNQVECGTCHNVHDNSVSPFLRASNAGSALCLACHIT